MRAVQHTNGFADSNGEISGKADLQFCGKLKREASSFDFLAGMLHIFACSTLPLSRPFVPKHDRSSLKNLLSDKLLKRIL